MITLEQVEKLREKADVGYEDAKAALESTDGDLLEAMILLEKQGKIPSPQMHTYNTQTGGEGDGRDFRHDGFHGHDHHRQYDKEYYHRKQRRFKRQMRTLWHEFCALIRKANANQFEIHRDGACIVSIPVTLLILAAVFFFWVTIPLLIIGLFFDLRYRLRGADFGKEPINQFMDQVADTAEGIKRAMMPEEEGDDSDRDVDGDGDLD